MENNEMNNVAEVVVDNAAEVVDNVVAKEDFATKHPYLNMAKCGAAIGTGVLGVFGLGALAVELGQKAIGKIKTKVAARKEAKAKKAEAVDLEESEE